MPLKRYIRNHAIAVLAMAVFAVYGFITTRLLPFNTLHCFMHDILHLYCPFCGGTRAFLALLQLDLLAMLTYNPAVVLATLFFLVLDLRALVLLLRHRDDALFPRFLLPLAVVWFLLYTVLRNALALFGIDPVGDIAPYWQGRITHRLPCLPHACCFWSPFLSSARFICPKGACAALLSTLPPFGRSCSSPCCFEMRGCCFCFSYPLACT